MKTAEDYAIEIVEQVNNGDSVSDVIQLLEDFASQFNSQKSSLLIPDIRNKLSPIRNLIAMIEHEQNEGSKDVYEAIQDEIKQCKKSIEYLSQFKTVEPEKEYHQHNDYPFSCYEIWRPTIPDDGCKSQCNECKEKQRLTTL